MVLNGRPGLEQAKTLLPLAAGADHMAAPITVREAFAWPSALSPPPYGQTHDAHALGNGDVGYTGATGKHDTGSMYERMWHCA